MGTDHEVRRVKLQDTAATVHLPSEDVAGLTRKRLEEIFIYIDGHLDSDLSVERFAELAHLSPSRFVRLFKQATGLTSCEYVNRRRVERAKEMILARQSLNLADIAARVGFADQAHLTRCFKRQVGTTPGRWREVNL